jgi:hypothetical protein
MQEELENSFRHLRWRTADAFNLETNLGENVPLDKIRGYYEDFF